MWKPNIHYVCSTGAASQNAVGDLSQSAQKPRAPPEAWFTQEKDISPYLTWTALLFCLSKVLPSLCSCQCLKEAFSHGHELRLLATALPSNITLAVSEPLKGPACNVNRCRVMSLTKVFNERQEDWRSVAWSCAKQEDQQFSWIIAFINNNTALYYNKLNGSMQLAKHMPCNYNIPALNVAPFSLILIQICFLGLNNYVNTALPNQVVQRLKCRCNNSEKKGN